jgi:hypothetical protein
MSDTMVLGGRRKEIWPAGQPLAFEEDRVIAITKFADTADYHPALIARIAELAKSTAASRPIGSAGGTKIYHLERWNCPEADFVSARAAALFAEILNAPGVIDISWANIYRRGDYSLPHSHVRSIASIVYFLDLGESGGSDPLGGRFSIVDPRLALCCPQQEECMTEPYLPGLSAGSMIIFPAQIVHWVHPYQGSRPRITLAWNFARKPEAA